MVFYKDRDWLKTKYIDEKLTQTEIANLCNVSQMTIQTWIKKFELNIQNGNRKTSDRISKKCEVCDKEVLLPPAAAKQRSIGHFFCSKQCQYIFRKNNPIKPTNDNIQVSLTCDCCKGEYFILRSLYKASVLRGYKNKFCSTKCRSLYQRGINSPFYIQDRTKVQNLNHSVRWCADMNDWRESVYKRDFYTCKVCGSQTNIEPHHIIPVSKDISLAFDIDNGITLCKTCHLKTFKKEEEFESLFKGLIETDKAHGRSRVSGQTGKGH